MAIFLVQLYSIMVKDLVSLIVIQEGTQKTILNEAFYWKINHKTLMEITRKLLKVVLKIQVLTPPPFLPFSPFVSIQFCVLSAFTFLCTLTLLVKNVVHLCTNRFWRNRTVQERRGRERREKEGGKEVREEGHPKTD